MNLKNKNWKTTGTGIAAIMVSIAAALVAFSDGDPETSVDFAALIAACIAGIGLVCARDGNKTSEAVGAK